MKIPAGKGYKDISPPTKELMKVTLEKKLAHGGNPAGNIKPDKEKSTKKTDGVVALVMALVMALDRSVRRENKSSVYDGRGILVL